MPPNVPSVPPIPVRDSLSQQPSSEGRIDEIIEPSPDHEIVDLQPSQKPIEGPTEQAQPRKSERIRIQQEKILPSAPVTRSQPMKSAEQHSSTLAFEDDEK